MKGVWVWGGKHCRMTTVSNAVGTRTVIPLLILIAWQNLMLMSENKVYLIFYSEIFVTDTRKKFIKKPHGNYLLDKKNIFKLEF